VWTDMTPDAIEWDRERGHPFVRVRGGGMPSLPFSRKVEEEEDSPFPTIRRRNGQNNKKKNRILYGDLNVPLRVILPSSMSTSLVGNLIDRALLLVRFSELSPFISEVTERITHLCPP